MKKNFILSWRGNLLCSGQQCNWVKAQGSSLSDKDKLALEQGAIVEKPKCKELTKVFARDEDGTLWSVIVHNLHLSDLESQLKGVGFGEVVLAAA